MGEKMKKYVKNLSWTQRLIMIFAVIVLGFYYYFSTGTLPFQKDTVSVNVQKTKDGEKVIKIEDVNNSVVVKEFPNDMTEAKVRTAIHQMSHQKVEANKKWGAIPLTPQRVNRLLKVVQEHDKA